jgi:hypothetical protein
MLLLFHVINCLTVCWLTVGLDPQAKARHALSLLDRLRAYLAAAGASAEAILQPTASALAESLGLAGRSEAQGVVDVLAEEVVRGSAAAALSLLLNAVEPRCASWGEGPGVTRLCLTECLERHLHLT